MCRIAQDCAEEGVSILFKQERYEQILQLLTVRRSATVGFLADTLHVSASTVRRDLQQLAEQGYLKHQYGGAVLIDESSRVPPIELRQQEMAGTKQRIGQAALSLVSSGDVLFIDASSTCLCMAEGLQRFSGLIVFTNGLQVLELLSSTGIETYSVGGKLLRNSMAFTGSFAEDFLQNVNIQKYFFSFQGLNRGGQMSDGGEMENRIHRILLRRPGMKIALCDKSKLGTNWTYPTGTLDMLDALVCDFSAEDLDGSALSEHTRLLSV